MKQYLNEVFNYKTGYYTTKAGKKRLMAYIDSSNSESTYQYKDKLRNDFGATYMSNIGTKGAWVWWLSGPNDSRIDTMVKPAIEFLTSVEKSDGGNSEKRNYLDVIDKLLKELSSVSEESDDVAKNNTHYMSKSEITQRLSDIKESIMTAMSSDEFLKRMEPIIKMRAACGYSFSLNNIFLIYVQDSEARDVRSVKNWEKLNRRVKPDAKMICLFYPKGSKVFKTVSQRKAATNQFLTMVNKKSEDELTPGEKERLRILLNKNNAQGGFNLAPYWCDVRFTEQIENTEDLYGDPSAINDLKWEDYDAEEGEYMNALIDAAIGVAKKSGLTVNFVPEESLHGAKGNATIGGIINLIDNAPKNIGMLNTVIHETAHQLLHFSYLKSNNSKVKDYFVGTSEGRGLVEQQAELTALIVLKELNLDSETSINYIGCWGGSKDNASAVFDSVAKAATYLTNEIIKVIRQDEKKQESND